KYDEKIYESCYRQISNNEEESPSNSENRAVSVITGAGIGFFFFGKKTVSNKEDEDRVVNCH
ncbi:14782_t:CDS:2, partial [Gigaspora rosea]